MGKRMSLVASAATRWEQWGRNMSLVTSAATSSEGLRNVAGRLSASITKTGLERLRMSLLTSAATRVGTIGKKYEPPHVGCYEGKVDLYFRFFWFIRASISSASIGISAIKSTGPFSVTRTSFSRRIAKPSLRI